MIIFPHHIYEQELCAVKAYAFYIYQNLLRFEISMKVLIVLVKFKQKTTFNNALQLPTQKA